MATAVNPRLKRLGEAVSLMIPGGVNFVPARDESEDDSVEFTLKGVEYTISGDGSDDTWLITCERPDGKFDVVVPPPGGGEVSCCAYVADLVTKAYPEE